MSTIFSTGVFVYRLIVLLALCVNVLFASLLSQPEFIDDRQVLKSLDIPYSFLNDPIFKKLKIDLTTRKRDRYLEIFKRGRNYIPTLKKMLAESGIPPVFLYMAMAESHFNVHARSSAKAVGLWQFMPETARLYGLKIDLYLDERRDPVRSTQAAIRYLKHLHNLFGKWYLAALAYNCGEGRVYRAIRKARSDDLHVLLDSRKKYLPKESRTYIRKIVSLALVANNAEFSFTPKELEAFKTAGIGSLERVQVSGGETVEHIAKQIGMKPRDLLELNPQFNYGFTPPRKGAQINIPRDYLDRFRQFYRPGKQKNMYLVHVVKKGETLYEIARRYGIPHQIIAKFNKIHRGIIYPKQELIVPIPRGSIHYYRVKPGDSIYKIARLFNTKVEIIKRRNGLRRNIIHVGDKLVIPH